MQLAKETHSTSISEFGIVVSNRKFEHRFRGRFGTNFEHILAGKQVQKGALRDMTPTCIRHDPYMYPT